MTTPNFFIPLFEFILVLPGWYVCKRARCSKVSLGILRHWSHAIKRLYFSTNQLKMQLKKDLQKNYIHLLLRLHLFTVWFKSSLAIHRKGGERLLIWNACELWMCRHAIMCWSTHFYTHIATSLAAKFHYWRLIGSAMCVQDLAGTE